MTHSSPTLTQTRGSGPARVTRFGLVNAYLVPEDDGLTLVDTTITGTDRAILDTAEALGQPIVRIVLTHAHGDHVGSLDELVVALPGVEVAISEREAPLLRKDRSPEPGEPADAKLRGGLPGTSTRPTRTLTDGDRVGSLEVVAAPGHTPGHLAFLDTRDGTLFAGDAFATLGGVVTSAEAYWRFPLLLLGTWHRPTALASAARLRDLRPSRLAAGHGPVVDDPAAAMAAAVVRGGG